ncbi:MAG: hypothetical protein ACYTBJ_22230 [Planctomycetota bacterium]|jgi:hypothetical protein
MSLKLIAVDGMTVEVEASQPTIEAVITVLPPTGTKGKCEGNLVHRDGDQISVSAIKDSTAGATTPDPGPHVVPINASIAKVKEKGTEVLAEGDESDVINAIPKIPGSPPVDYPVSFKCVITDAGQTTGKAQ